VAIARWFGWHPFTGHFVPLFFLTAASATVAAAVSWYLVERPLLRRFSSSWRRPTRRDQAANEDNADRHEAEQLHTGAAR
jgi:peptidoglycan/LPS O-acetylase OafA/YrhL